MNDCDLKEWLINEAIHCYEMAMNALDPVIQEIWWQRAIHEMDLADDIQRDN